MSATTEPKTEVDHHPPHKRYPRFQKAWVFWAALLFVLGWASWTLIYPLFI